MREALVAKVAVAGTALRFDKLYDYLIPYGDEDKIKPGMRVLVPFGSGNRKRQGIVTEVVTGTELDKLKPVASVPDEEPVLNDEMLALGAWMAERTFCTRFEAMKVLLPAGADLRMVAEYRLRPDFPEERLGELTETEQKIVEILRRSGASVERGRLLEIMGLDSESPVPDRLCEKGFLLRSDDAVRKVGDKVIRMVRLCADPEDLPENVRLTPKQESVLGVLRDVGCASVKELCYFLGITPAVVTALAKKGIVDFFDEEVYRNPYDTVPKPDCKPVVLSESQEAAFHTLSQLARRGEAACALLYGVTGSGKTQVYLKLIEDTLARGRGVIVMVPEIALTPQIISLFRARFGEKVAVFHSALSVGRRMDEWKRVKRGEAMIAVGTRSAVFAPFENPGLIVMDEEQESSYKSESAPRFHARDVARFRAARHKALLVLASATPSVETYTAALKGRYTLCRLEGRFGNALLPRVETVDMRAEAAAGGTGLLSSVLRRKMAETLDRGEQIILLLNRRGHHTFVSCRSCGHVMTCPDCSVSLTYHSANGRLMCHFCGRSLEAVRFCPECKSEHIRASGYGTQRAEAELAAFFPDARVLRMDADSVMTRGAYEEKLERFASGEFDILLGTQMVAKGLNFPKVTLVGVLTADQNLYTDDFRGFERAFSLLTQVVGRSGRGDVPGTALIQTHTPDNAVIRLAAAQDYDAFYRQEMLSRKLLVFPPYCDFCLVGFSGPDYDRVKAAAGRFLSGLKETVQSRYPNQNLIVLGPAPAGVPKVSGKYRCKIIIKCRNNREFREMLRELMVAFGNHPKNKNITVFADMNPTVIL